MHKHRRRLLEAGRFLAVGGVATIVALFLFNLLVHGLRRGGGALLADHVLVAYVVANTVGMVVSYRGSRSWAFRDRPPVQADGGRLAFLRDQRGHDGAADRLPVRSAATCSGSTTRSRTTCRRTSIGLFLGLVARFYLFRIVIFRRPSTAART